MWIALRFRLESDTIRETQEQAKLKKSTARFSAAIMGWLYHIPSWRRTPRPRPMIRRSRSPRSGLRIAQLEAAQKQADLQRREAESKLEAKATADELSTAEQADHFLSPEGFTAGYSDSRFVIQSSDGNFTWRPWAHLQIRDVTLLRKDQQGPAKDRSDEVDNGFEIRQLRFGFDGNLFGPASPISSTGRLQRTSSNVNVSGATPSAPGGKVTVSNSLGGGLVLQQASVKYQIPTTSIFLKLGAIKDPLMHEQIVDTRFQQGAERSITADIFANGDDFTEGARSFTIPAKTLRSRRA